MKPYLHQAILKVNNSLERIVYCCPRTDEINDSLY